MGRVLIRFVAAAITAVVVQQILRDAYNVFIDEDWWGTDPISQGPWLSRQSEPFTGTWSPLSAN